MPISRRALWVALLAVIAAACAGGSDPADDTPVFTPAGEESESLADSGTTLVPPVPEDPPEIEGATLAGAPIPCGAEAEPGPGGGVGVDATTISIATGNDEGARFVTQSGGSVPAAVSAMAEHCNSLGGLAGRVVTVEADDAAVSEVAAAAARQCDRALAVVGHAYLQESLGVSTWDGCDLPRFSAWPSDLLDPVPSPLFAHQLVAGGDPSGLVAIVAPDSTAGRAEAENVDFELRSAGFTVVGVELYPITAQPDWDGISERLGAAGAAIVHLVGSCRGATMPLAAAGGDGGPVLIAGASSYDDACRVDALDDGVPVEKVLLQVPFLPVEDGQAAPATAAFAEIYATFGAAPTGDALLAGAAFWEFALAAGECAQNDLSRRCLSERRPTGWDGFGVLAPSADRSCRVVMTVAPDGFERLLPEEPGQFVCTS